MSNEEMFLVLFGALGTDSYFSGATTFFAQWFPYLLILAVMVYELYQRDEGGIARSLLRIFLPAVIILIFAEVIKYIFPSPRPFVSLSIEPLFIANNPMGSFPSSHTAFFAALAMTMLFCRRSIGYWCFAGALVIGIARIGAGVHWPLDVAAGFVFGGVLGLAIDRLIALVWKTDPPKC